MKILQIVTIILIIVTIVLLSAVVFPSLFQKTEVPENVDNIKADETVLEASIRIMRLIKERDFDALSKTVHSEKGVTFSPNYFIEPESSISLTPEKLKGAALDKTVYNWGLSAGRGDAIKLTIEDYFDEYVFPHDFTKPEVVSINRARSPYSSAEIIEEVYPGSDFTEFYFSGFDPQYEGLDWSATQLVLQKEAGEWKLIGVVAGYWTP